jgi:RimJ/RimL family protein N-acetyltransferase
MSEDPEVMRYLGKGKTKSQAETLGEIAAHLCHWAALGFGQWALERKEDGESIGRAGFWRPPGWPGLEVGWKLRRDAWGRGYATEAGAASIAWGWENLDAEELISIIHPGNTASIAVAERLGLRHLRDSHLKGQEVAIFGIGRP